MWEISYAKEMLTPSLWRKLNRLCQGCYTITTKKKKLDPYIQRWLYLKNKTMHRYNYHDIIITTISQDTRYAYILDLYMCLYKFMYINWRYFKSRWTQVYLSADMGSHLDYNHTQKEKWEMSHVLSPKVARVEM